MKKIVLTFLLSCAVLLISGCVTSQTYYQPSSRVGKVYKSLCHGTMGFPDGLIFSQGKNHVWIRTYRKIENPEVLVLQLRLEAFEKKRIEFNSSRIEIVTSGKTENHKFKSIRPFNFKPPYSDITIPFQQIITETSYECYLFIAELPVVADQFTVRLPGLRIDDIVFDFGQIDFIKVSGWVFMPLNC